MLKAGVKARRVRANPDLNLGSHLRTTTSSPNEDDLNLVKDDVAVL